jgi:hypothetical protein
MVLFLIAGRLFNRLPWKCMISSFSSEKGVGGLLLCYLSLLLEIAARFARNCRLRKQYAGSLIDDVSRKQAAALSYKGSKQCYAMPLGG